MTAPANSSTTTRDAIDDAIEVVLGIGPEQDVEDGSYPGQLLRLERFTAERDGEPVELIRWTFGIDVEQGDPIEVSGVSSTARGPRAKATAWLLALVGAEAKPGVSFRASELAGRSAMVTIVHDANGFPKVDTVVAAPKSRKA